VQPKQYGPCFAAHIVDVEVDPETGKVQILRYTAVQDAGKAIYPDYVESQMQGGVAQGVGWALNEEYFYDESGRLLNASLLDYRMPIALDLPMIETIIVEVPNPGHPYGARGVGEVPIVPPACRDCQCHLSRYRRSYECAADVACARCRGAQHTKRMIACPSFGFQLNCAT
jgi:CO/xanthine dehydrogenase Mo-binding subunit